MVDVWLNYDCDSNCEDVFERMIAFLTKVCLRLLNTVRGLTVPQECPDYRSSATWCPVFVLGFVAGFHTAYGRTSLSGEGIGKRPGSTTETELAGSTMVASEKYPSFLRTTLM